MKHFCIETEQLSYTFIKGENMLHNINLQVEEGCIFGFLGPNSAGKTKREDRFAVPCKETVARITKQLVQKEMPVYSIEKVQHDLETIFMNLTNT